MRISAKNQRLINTITFLHAFGDIGDEFRNILLMIIYAMKNIRISQEIRYRPGIDICNLSTTQYYENFRFYKQVLEDNYHLLRIPLMITLFNRSKISGMLTLLILMPSERPSNFFSAFRRPNYL